MAGAVVLTANIVAGPTGASDCGFPSGVTNISFNTYPPQKPAPAATGDRTQSLNAAADYVTLDGVGPTSAVTQANFLFLRMTAGVTVRLTQKNLSGGSDIVSEVQVQGTLLLEFPNLGYLKGLEAKGVGTVEYFASGNQ